jgi:hypothetical protein
MNLVLPLNYVVVYDDGPQTEQPPELFSSLEPRYVPALSGLLFALQLPRHRQDAIDASYEILLGARSLEQRPRIHFLPKSKFAAPYFASIPRNQRILAVGPDDLLETLTAVSTELSFALPPLSFEQLSTAKLRSTWNDIAVIAAPDEVQRPSNQTLVSFDVAPTEVPMGFLLHHLADTPIRPITRTNRERVENGLHLVTLLSTLAALEGQDVTPEDAQKQLPRVYRSEQEKTRMPMVLSAPGVSPNEVKVVARRLKSTPGQLRNLDQRLTSDFAVMQLLAASAATRLSGLGIATNGIPAGAFTALKNVEAHWATGARPKKIRGLLATLNAESSGIWTDELRIAVARASSLTVFSNFPIGMLTFPGDSAPLAYRLPIVYRPLSSLSSALAYEFGPNQTVDLSSGFRVLVAECIDARDEVGQYSRSGWDHAQTMLRESGENVDLVRVDVSSAAELEQAIEREQPDVLIVSAHGVEQDGVAGIRIGEEFYTGGSQRGWPPVVILSACRVAPRGAGGPNIADRILEQGAVAVIAPQVDVDVRHNALLCVRMFVYMTEAIKGKQPETDLKEVWHKVQGTSPITDVMNGTGALRKWISEPGNLGRPRFVQFMNEAARGRLRKSHIFEDTERFLIELAAEEKREAEVRGWIAQPGYLPESMFYSIAGFPENVLFKRRQILSLPTERSRQTP